MSLDCLNQFLPQWCFYEDKHLVNLSSMRENWFRICHHIWSHNPHYVLCDPILLARHFLLLQRCGRDQNGLLSPVWPISALHIVHRNMLQIIVCARRACPGRFHTVLLKNRLVCRRRDATSQRCNLFREFFAKFAHAAHNRNGCIRFLCRQAALFDPRTFEQESEHVPGILKIFASDYRVSSWPTLHVLDQTIVYALPAKASETNLPRSPRGKALLARSEAYARSSRILWSLS